MNVVIPMVGLGQRFKKSGYEIPKPLLPVDGRPMVARVVEDLPAADRVVVVVNHDHIAEFAIDEKVREHIPTATIVVAPGLTDGQASSVQLGLAECKTDAPVLVAACDNTHLFNQNSFETLTADPVIDGLIWTYRGEPRVLENPNWYGWVEADAQGIVSKVSVKSPVSTQPLGDHVVSGCFWFRSANVLNEGIEELKRLDRRVNGELYLDSVPEILIAMNRQIRVFEVEKYIGWGTPHDYEDYHLWSRYVRERC